MTDQQLFEEFDALDVNEKKILALLAMIGEPVGKTSIFEHVKQAGMAYKIADLTQTLQHLVRLAFLSEVSGRGFSCNAKMRWIAMRAALYSNVFNDLCASIETVNPMRRRWDGFVELRSYQQGVARLRMALLRGQAPQQVLPLLAACMACYEASQLHPLIEICGRPFEAEMLAAIHPQLQDEILAVLLDHAQRQPDAAPPLDDYAGQLLARRHAAGDPITPSLRFALAEHAILCGRLDDAAQLLAGTEGGTATYLASVAALLRGEETTAIDGFQAAL